MPLAAPPESLDRTEPEPEVVELGEFGPWLHLDYENFDFRLVWPSIYFDHSLLAAIQEVESRGFLVVDPDESGPQYGADGTVTISLVPASGDLFDTYINSGD